MSQETWTRKRTAARHSDGTISPTKNGRRWEGRPSVLANQKVEKRIRNKVNSVVTKYTESVPVVRRQRLWNNFSGRDIGLRALEGGVFLVAGIGMIAKTGLESLFGLFRNSREENGNFAVIENNDNCYGNDRVEPELEGASRPPLVETNDLRENVEEMKVITLHEEETGLPSELLDDQAGALRSLVLEGRE